MFDIVKPYRESQYTKFMEESNRIEGEDRLNPGDITAIEMADIDGLRTQTEIKSIHRILTKHLNVNWSGVYRKINVRVGTYVAPDYKKVPKLMRDYIKKLPNMDAWTAHNEFEKIHPFRDFNGRMGRLIWYSKMDNPKLGFLHTYYYQTLDHINKEE